MEDLNKFIKYDDIFVDNSKEKRTRTIALILSMIFHSIIIYYIIDHGSKNNPVKHKNKIRYVEIAPLYAPNIKSNIEKQEKKTIVAKLIISASNTKGPRFKNMNRSEINSQLNLKTDNFKIGSSVKNKFQLNNFLGKSSGMENFKIMERKRNDISGSSLGIYPNNLSMNDILKKSNESILKNGNDVISSTFQPGEVHKYQYGVGNLVDHGGRSFQKRKGFNIIPWANKTLVKIKNFWKIPHSLNPKIRGEVGVSVVFNKGGDIRSLKVDPDATNQVFKQAAINAFNLGSPFEPLPDKILENKLRSYFIFNYYPSQRSKKEKVKMEPGSITNINPIIKSIGLVMDRHFLKKKLPENLSFLIDSSQKVFYKVLNEEKILNGGELNKGFNIVRISSENLFSKNQTYEYYLEIMNKRQKYKNKFFVDMRLILPENSGVIEEKIKSNGYGIAMFLENQLIAYHQKPIVYVPPSERKGDLESEINGMSSMRGPLDFVGGDQYKRSSLPILGMALLAYKKIVEQNKKKKKSENKLQAYKLLKGSFLRKDLKGLEQPIEITLSLRKN